MFRTKKVEDKSDEITAIPELLEDLNLQGSVVSIDAIGCQTQIAQKIRSVHADYLLAIKQNQGTLYEEISTQAIWNKAQVYDEQWEYDHGRYEERRARIAHAKDCLTKETLATWLDLKTLIRIDTRRTIGESTSTQTRFYISSQSKQAKYYNDAVRGHWSIENHLHWHLDVAFSEDASRSRSGFSAQNLNVLRKMALQRISSMKDKLSLQKRRFKASMNTEYLTKVILKEF